eukprot:scaffold3603_cov136-Isochrysis_galbana.AAC.6
MKHATKLDVIRELRQRGVVGMRSGTGSTTGRRWRHWRCSCLLAQGQGGRVCAYARDLSVAFAFALALRSLGDSDSLPPTNSPNTTTPTSRSVRADSQGVGVTNPNPPLEDARSECGVSPINCGQRARALELRRQSSRMNSRGRGRG